MSARWAIGAMELIALHGQSVEMDGIRLCSQTPRSIVSVGRLTNVTQTQPKLQGQEGLQIESVIATMVSGETATLVRRGQTAITTAMHKR